MSKLQDDAVLEEYRKALVSQHYVLASRIYTVNVDLQADMDKIVEAMDE